MGPEPTTLYTLDRALYQLSYQGNTAGWAQISHLIDMYMYMYMLPCCLFDLACSFLPSFSLNINTIYIPLNGKQTYFFTSHSLYSYIVQCLMYMYCTHHVTCTCTSCDMYMYMYIHEHVIIVE